MKRQLKLREAQRFLKLSPIQKFLGIRLTLNNDPSQIIADYNPQLHSVQVNGRAIVLTSRDEITVDADIPTINHFSRELSFMVDELHLHDLANPDATAKAHAEDW